MAIDDSSPERRNLTIISLAFIVFTLADGEFLNDTMQLQVINVKFNRPDVLIIFAWAMLFWFTYRYWLVHRGKFKTEFRQEFTSYAAHPIIEKFVSKKLNGKLISDDEDGYRVFDIWWENWLIRIRAQYTGKISRHPNRKYASHENPAIKQPDKQARLQGINGWFYGLLVTALSMLKNPSFSGYVVPYILAIFAIISGIFRLIS